MKKILSLGTIIAILATLLIAAPASAVIEEGTVDKWFDT
jgi:hypothetical protein